jgi:hypothetical protein
VLPRFPSALLASLVCAATVSLVQSAPAAPQWSAGSGQNVCDLQTTDRIVAVGDVHGAYDKFLAILREAGIIDNRRRWSGGRAHFVQTGDTLDRGPASREVLDLLRKLEPEAERAGGKVHVLLGNHEVMRMFDVRAYISPGEFDEFRTIDSDELRDRAFEVTSQDHVVKHRAKGESFDVPAFRKRFYDETPLGSVEMQIAFAGTGDYGKWLRTKPVMVKINGIVFVHGGISPAIAPLGCAQINAQARAEVTAGVPLANQPTALVTSLEGPLWYRGLVDGNPAIGPAEVDTILKALDARTMVVGHTPPADYKMRALFDGRVIQIDTGMLGGQFYPGGTPSALEIAGDTFTAIYEGRREPIK